MKESLQFSCLRTWRKFYNLKRSLYGFKQSSKQWYLKFHKKIKLKILKKKILKIGYEMIPLDHYDYVWRCNEKLIILSILLLYEDDKWQIISWKLSKFDVKNKALPSIKVWNEGQRSNNLCVRALQVGLSKPPA